jgi:replicative DNA helicase
VREPIPCTDIESEALYIRSCIGVSAAPQVRHLLEYTERLSPADCASEPHAAILAALYERVDARQQIWHSDMRRALLDGKQLLAAEALEQALIEPGPEERPAKALAETLRELARRRRKYVALQRAQAALIAGNEDAADEYTLSAAHEAAESKDGEFLQAAATIELTLAERAASSGGSDRRTGFPHVDRAIGSMHAQTLTVIGGTTGSGKSSLMLAMAMKQAERGMRVGIVSVEDAPAVWGPRVLSHVSDVNPERWDKRDAWFDKQCESGIAIARERGVHFAFELGRPLNDILRACRHLVRRFGCQLLYVDYLQAISDPQQHERKRFISNAGAKLKAQAQHLGATLVLGSQLSRPAKGNPFAEVFFSDLKESGDIENMSEVIMLLWKTGDDDDALALGKVAKVKWSPKRPRFEIQRDPNSGCIVSLVPPIEVEQLTPRLRLADPRAAR